MILKVFETLETEGIETELVHVGGRTEAKCPMIRRGWKTCSIRAGRWHSLLQKLEADHLVLARFFFDISNFLKALEKSASHDNDMRFATDEYMRGVSNYEKRNAFSCCSACNNDGLPDSRTCPG
ncbi:hypothetical protein [Prosthecochloris sp. SCSIO W1101]|uniref:hypothetical protein n=1 Tax=Prosthecochloris sp. SCSIO W1101 TaxID=2992242 RepID=UPI0039FBD040